uniref:Uncharacterized protein n=1 Tax=Anguilla anguilla TaxID=7936 RepID=A0A0E9R095_ANGAN
MFHRRVDVLYWLRYYCSSRERENKSISFEASELHLVVFFFFHEVFYATKRNKFLTTNANAAFKWLFVFLSGAR